MTVLPRHRHAEAFEAAWEEFTEVCAGTVAPEATYQAWLAHIMIRRTGLLRVVREVDFGTLTLARWPRHDSVAAP